MTTPAGQQGWTRVGNLRGPEGKPGTKGDTGAQGVKGDAGAQGAKGDAGVRGPGWLTAGLTGGTVPDQAGSIVGDLLYDSNTGDTYVRTA